MEIAFSIKAKHGYIYRYLQENNMSAKELSKQIGLSEQTMGKLINFVWAPGRDCDTIDKLEAYFKIPFEQLFPEPLVAAIEKKLGRKRTVYKEIDFVSLEGLDERHLIDYLTPESEIIEREIGEERMELFSTLSPREEKVLRLRLGTGVWS